MSESRAEARASGSTGAGSYPGRLFHDGDEEYEEARAVWNGEIDRRPSAVARCRDAADVAAALGYAKAEGLDVSVRGGGHNFAGHAVCDGGLMIDLSPLRRITVDPDARRVRCGGGATWAELDAVTQHHGLALPGGVISHTGVGGLTLGGGFGWLSRLAGLSCDNLLSAEVVLADGSIVNSSPDEHPDLFWALTGGGGNFGVVTSFEFALHPVGPLVQLGMFFWPADQAGAALRYAQELEARLAHRFGVLVAGLTPPPAPFVPDQYQGRSVFTLAVVDWQLTDEHHLIVDEIRATVPPAFELVTPLPYCELQKMLDDSAPWGAFAYEKALYIDQLTDDVVAVLCDHLPRKASPLSIVPINPLAGAYCNRSDDETAFAGRRERCWSVTVAAVCPSRELLEIDRAWVRQFWDALRPFAHDSGSYINFLSDTGAEGDARTRASYGPAKYDRLARIKAVYDPDNTFSHNANIRPANDQ